jgi:protein-tyrosine kinase
MNSIEKALLKKQTSSASESVKHSSSSIEKSAELLASKKEVNVNQASLEQRENESLHTRFIDIDLNKLSNKGFVSSNSGRQLINEEYRAIKRKILDNAFGALSKSLTNPNIIMVTSSRPGEGKTFTAINLALSIALEQDKTVLLVDADVLRPNIMKTLELNDRQGLIEYLLGEKSNIADVMYQTNISNLRIIPAGKSHHLSTELLASERMYQAVEEFANRYTDRVVIVDTPPLLGINETAILANLAGQAIVVTEENKTKLTDLDKAVKQLNPEMAIGFVVNKSQSATSDVGYGYYYRGAN